MLHVIVISMQTSKNHFLQLVEQQIKESLKWDEKSSFSAEPTLFAAAKHLCLSNGAKRARPKLIYFFSEALQINSALAIDIAVTSEFIHSASLLHDDVIDNGTLRRGSPTVNVVWDELTAVLAGDILLAESIKGLKKCPRVISLEALQLVSEMTKATMLEAHIRNKNNVSIEQWNYIAQGKTASMFQWCGRSVGHIANDLKAVECFDNFGKHFGLAFQLADDLLDVYPTESGKTPFADLRNRNPSYPIILALQYSKTFSRALIKTWEKETISESEIAYLGETIISTGAAEHTLERINKEVQLSIEALDEYVNLPGVQIIAQWALEMCLRFKRSEAV
jgi:heptaprenyl diphosphate synthase